MKKMIKTWVRMAMLMSIIIGMSSNTFLTAFAVETCPDGFDCEETGTIIIDYRFDNNSLDNVQFKVYQITTMDENTNHHIVSAFKNVEIELEKLSNESYWIKSRDNLENYINYKAISPDQIFYTNDAGQYNLDDLELGIYFIQAEMVAPSDSPEITDVKNQILYSQPILIAVGSYDGDGEKWVYHYNIQPKIAVANADTTQLEVTKIWKNTKFDNAIPDEIEVELHRNGEKYDSIILSKENKWTYTWSNIDPCDCWGVKEVTQLKDYKVTYEKDLCHIKIINTYIGKSDVELPQTGTMAYFIPIIASFGLFFLILGVLLGYVTNKKCVKNHGEYHEKDNQ